MALNYLEISYPNFVLGAIIDPEEANQNNFDLQTKINDTITAHNLLETKANDLEVKKATIVYVDGKVTTLNNTITSNVSNLAGTGRTTETIKQNATNMITHKSSSDHDARYYIKSDIDSRVNTINTNHNSLVGVVNSHKSSSDHDNRYYTKGELTPWLRGGDTSIKEDVFIITNANNGDGTFQYTVDGQTVIGTLGENGEQIFNLVSGVYEPDTNRIYAMVNDTLRRSVKSGGLQEINNSTVMLTSPEGSGAEITFVYYERLGMTAEYNIKLSTTKPPLNDGKTMWFEVI